MPKEKGEKKRLVLLDAHAIIHRAYHALPDFVSSKGEPTGALYGLAAMLMRIIEDLKPDYLAACYDRPEATFRHEAYKDYKAKRPKADETLVSQIIRSRDIFTAFSIPLYDVAGFEADDVLGTIVEKLEKEENLDIIIASGDMDTLQLVQDRRVCVYTLKKGISDTVLYDEEAVKARFGFLPKLLPDYKGLRGDPSDNIIGIKGVGEKTAATLVQTFGTIEVMYLALKKKEDKKFLDAGITPRIVELLRNNEEEAIFSKTLALIRRDAPISFEIPVKPWRLNFSVERAVELFRTLEMRTLAERVKRMFGAPEASVESDGTIASEEGRVPSSERELKEISVALWLVDSNLTNPSLEDIFFFAKTRDFDKAKALILAELKKRGLERIYLEIELPLIPILEKMEKRGIKVDRTCLEKLSKEYHRRIDEITKRIFKLSGAEFNVNSPRQLGDILFDRLALTTRGLRKTEGGARSTRESELLKLKDAHPVVAEILAHREIQKLLSTYIDTMPALLDNDLRLHTTFIQTGSTTGRMASQNPNLQNIPIKSEAGRAIRAVFVAENGHKLIAFDYSQMELRVAAFLSGDRKLIDIFKRREDVHTEVAAEVFKVPKSEVTKEMRRQAKVINFGILYGMGVNALRENLMTDRKAAQEFYKKYFETFSTLATYLEKVKASALRLGYTETLFGRRRYLEGLQSKIPYVRAAAERMAVNAPIQGTEADIVKFAMVNADRLLEKENFKDTVHPLLQVHDEIIYEVEESVVEEVVPILKNVLEGVLTLKETSGVPIVVEAHVGDNWGEMK